MRVSNKNDRDPGNYNTKYRTEGKWSKLLTIHLITPDRKINILAYQQRRTKEMAKKMMINEYDEQKSPRE